MQLRRLALPAGIVLIAADLALQGLSAFPHLAEHLRSDFTVDLGIHAFIAGWVLLAYGIVRALRSR